MIVLKSPAWVLARPGHSLLLLSCSFGSLTTCSSAPVTVSMTSTKNLKCKTALSISVGPPDSLIDRGEALGRFGLQGFVLRFGRCGGTHGKHTHTHTECLAAITVLSTGKMRDNQVSFPLLPSVPYSVCWWEESSLDLFNPVSKSKNTHAVLDFFTGICEMTFYSDRAEELS